jgi:cell shape-determining protein MreD
MTYLYHIFVGSCLIVFQTGILPFFPYSNSFYDILVPFIIYLSAYRPVRESIPIAILLGVFVDSFSGSYFGVYVTTYLWLVISIRWISSVIHLENYVLLPLIVVIGILLDNLILFLAIMIANPEFQFSASIMGVIAAQIFWAICTGPFFLVFYNTLFGFLKIEQE